MIQFKFLLPRFHQIPYDNPMIFMVNQTPPYLGTEGHPCPLHTSRVRPEERAAYTGRLSTDFDTTLVYLVSSNHPFKYFTSSRAPTLSTMSPADAPELYDTCSRESQWLLAQRRQDPSQVQALVLIHGLKQNNTAFELMT
jgi:hypothetical protein